jgi:RHS repeat-associated protein
MHLQTHTEKTASTKKTVCRARAAGGYRPLSRTASGVSLHRRKARVRKCSTNENPSALGAFKYNLRMPGQVWDQETGTFYNWNRDYDPQLGRYVQSDPIGMGGGINTYGYVRANPVKLIDWDGLQIETPGDPVPGRFGGGNGESVIECGQRIARDVGQRARGWNFDSKADGTPWNAMLHCVWNCEMVKSCGAGFAALSGSAHELYDGNRKKPRSSFPIFDEPKESAWDLRNNQQGRECGVDCMKPGSTLSCYQCCDQKRLNNNLNFR